MMHLKIKTADYILLTAIGCYILSACNSHKAEVQATVEKMQSSTITIPYERMECWASDSILEDRPWNKAKLKLVHYVDSATCSTCYLQKIAIYGLLFSMEAQSNNDFYNVFIINPNIIAKKKLISDFSGKLIPKTIFVDSSNVFMESNPNLPSESMYHTFMLDENNRVILVGNPMLNKQIEDMMLSIVDEKFGNNLSQKVEKNIE